MKLVKVVLAACAFSFAGNIAGAVTVESCIFQKNGTTFDVTNNVTPSTACYGLVNLADGAGKEGELEGEALAGVTDWTSLGKYEPTGSNLGWSIDTSNPSTVGGNWSISSALTGTYNTFLLVLKAGQDRNTDPASFVAYLLGGSSGTWLSPHIDNNGDPRGLSNAELYGANRAGVFTPVPVPASLPLLLAGVAGLAFVRRKRG